MDAETRAAFVAHVKDLERIAIEEDDPAALHAAKSLACMALIRVGEEPPNGGGEIIDFVPYLRLVA